MTFQERIMHLRTVFCVPQKEIADAAHITVRQYQRYETATSQPTLPVLIALAEYFDVSIDYLVGRTDNPAVNR